MKLITATTFALSLYKTKAEEEVEAPDQRRFSSIIGMAFSQVTTAYDRGDFEDRISKYGCHCFPGDTKSAGGSGPPTDAIDAVCKKLGKCHKCVQLEFGEGAIDVNDGRYSWELANDGSIDCSKNGNERLALCECDAQFANEMKTVWDDSAHNDFFWKNNRHARQNPTFDHDATCVTSGSGSAADACCGNGFPSMEPYTTADKGCCDVSGQIFNVMTHECCHDGTISSIGAC